jgi:hypothetical protein
MRLALDAQGLRRSEFLGARPELGMRDKKKGVRITGARPFDFHRGGAYVSAH